MARIPEKEDLLALIEECGKMSMAKYQKEWILTIYVE